MAETSDNRKNNDTSVMIFKGKRLIVNLTPMIGLIGLIIICSLIVPKLFMSLSNWSNILRQVTILGFAALGMTIVILTGNIDLSVIGNVSMTTCLAAILLQHNWNLIPTFAIVILAGAFIGLINGLIISFWKIESFVVTMGMQVICFGLAQYISGGRTIIIQNLNPFMIELASYRIANIIPGMFVILIIFYIILWIFTRNTKLGRYIYALGGNEEVCYISGVNVTFVRTTAYIISGIFAAIAGIFTFSRSLCGDPTAGSSLGMYVIAAVVIGGTKMSGGRGNVLFTIIGIFVIGIINNMLNLIGFKYYAQQIIQGIIIISAVIAGSQKRR